MERYSRMKWKTKHIISAYQASFWQLNNVWNLSQVSKISLTQPFSYSLNVTGHQWISKISELNFLVVMFSGR